MKLQRVLTSIVMLLMLAIPFAQAFESNTEVISEAQAQADLTELEDQIPTYDQTEAQLTNWNRFLLWTHDGVNVMWGKFGNGYFIGEDNSDKHTWGVYGSHVFAGFYDGEFFYGKYRSNIWKARGLFGEASSKGKFEVFRNEPPQPPVCRDSDGGFNVRKQGKIISCVEVDGEKLCDEGKDYCVDDSHVLVEHYCTEEGEIGMEKFECPYGCRNGACVKPTVCPTVYEPVCASVSKNSSILDVKKLKTFANRCELEKVGGVLVHEGACEVQANASLKTDAKLKTPAGNVETQNQLDANALLRI